MCPVSTRSRSLTPAVGMASIIQAVGRAVRLAPGKETGTIVLPVVLRKGESFDVALARSEHRSIVDILGALRSHDTDIIKSLDVCASPPARTITGRRGTAAS